MLSRFIRASRGHLRRDKVERELDAELDFHLECQIQENRERGMTPDESRRLALLSFGRVESVKGQSREVRGIAPFDEAWQDLRFGLRMLRRNRSFTIVAILALALGIGANTAIFSVIDAVLLRPLPFNNAERLVTIMETNPT